MDGLVGGRAHVEVEAGGRVGAELQGIDACVNLHCVWRVWEWVSLCACVCVLSWTQGLRVNVHWCVWWVWVYVSLCACVFMCACACVLMHLGA